MMASVMLILVKMKSPLWMMSCGESEMGALEVTEVGVVAAAGGGEDVHDDDD